jgi:hypothetical protein
MKKAANTSHMTMRTTSVARDVLVAWAKSEGFAAIHNGAATDEQIVDDLLAYLDERGFRVEQRNPPTCSGEPRGETE